MIVGRIVTGLGNGLNTATIPVYQTECSKAHHRGRAVVIEMATKCVAGCVARPSSH